MIENQLKKFFGYEKFRENQLEIIKHILARKNTLAVMPTGSGKSLCYQLPALAQEGTAIIVSPLIALMKNQVDSLKKKGIKACFLNSTLTKKKIKEIYEDILKGNIKLLYIAPETLNKEETISSLKEAKISFIAVDEAHCISEWGYDFRPEYAKLRNTIEILGNLPVIALTATATPRTQIDILKKLNIENTTVFKASFERPNLHYKIKPKKNTEKTIINFLKEHPNEAGIIYCHSRKKVEEITQLLKVNKIKTAAYHAGLDNNTRIANQDAFLDEKVSIMVATIAFGMGVDKPNVRFVIHYDTPKSIENYYQETGRAGRDGKKSICILFYDPKDVSKLESLNTKKGISKRENANLLLREIRDFIHCAICIRIQILNYFGEKSNQKCNQCTNCLAPTQTYQGRDLVVKVLTAIKETKFQLNFDLLSKFICGFQDSYIENQEFNTCPSFGSGKNEIQPFWRSVIRQIMLMGYINRAFTESPFSISSKGEDFLKKPQKTLLFKERTYALFSDDKAPEIHSVDQNLLKKLLLLREEEARIRKIKPYLIFQEQTLESMATYYTSTLNAMTFLPNVSLSKAQKFGHPFINLINNYIQEHDIKPIEEMILKPSKNKFSNRIQLIKQIDKKIDLEELAEKNNISYFELLKELQDICNAGIRLNIDYYINTVLQKEEQDDIYDYFFHELEENNVERACDELADEYDEDQIRLMYIKFISEVAN